MYVTALLLLFQFSVAFITKCDLSIIIIITQPETGPDLYGDKDSIFKEPSIVICL